MVGMEVPLTTKLAGAAEAVVKRRVQVRSSEHGAVRGGLTACSAPAVFSGYRLGARATDLRSVRWRGTDMGMRPNRGAAGAGRRAAYGALTRFACAGEDRALPPDCDRLGAVRLCARHGGQQEDIAPGRRRPRGAPVLSAVPQEPARYLHQRPLPAGSGTPANVPSRMQRQCCRHFERRAPRSLLRTSFAAGP